MNRQESHHERLDIFTITDLETLKAVSTPFRQKLMQLMAGEPRTVKDMAAELGMPPSRLYYHVNQLEKHGVIQVAGTRIVSGILEKHYQVSARAYRVDRALLAPGGDEEEAAIQALLASTLEATETEIRRGLHTGVIDLSKQTSEPGAVFIGRTDAYLTPEQYLDFKQRLYDLYQEFEAIGATSAAAGEEGVQLTAMLAAFYPATPHPPED